jgi:hypothetical protein
MGNKLLYRKMYVMAMVALWQGKRRKFELLPERLAPKIL